MRYTIGFAAVAALASLALAEDAPTAETEIGQTFAATLPDKGGVTGSVLGSGAPSGVGSNIQISLFNLPKGVSLSMSRSAGLALYERANALLFFRLWNHGEQS